MCGILFAKSNRIGSEEFINALESMKHRGPDHPKCYFSFEDYYLGHNRLSIIDLDERSNQPLFSKDSRFAIVFNGEIYNYKELAKTYCIETITSSDTEVLLELFIRLGPKMLEQLNGMFSLIILDTLKKSFFVARDRLGVKPLYYYVNGNDVIFSSEIYPIIKLIEKVSIDEFGLRQYRKMRNFYNGRTIYNEIKEFPAAHYMIDSKLYRYWDLNLDDQKPPSDEELRYLIETSVKYRMNSDVSVGSYLSGGLDSTIVAGLSQVDHTWTVGFEDNNEFEWSDLAAVKFNTTHHKILCNKIEFLELAKSIIKQTKVPISVPNEVLLFKMTREVKKYNTVILSGEGADEIFYGYDRVFRWAFSAKTWDIEQFSELYTYGSFSDLDIVDDALSPFYKYESPLKIVAGFFQIAHLQGLLRRLDRSTMLCDVEARGPFLDYRLVERLAGVSFEYKMENGIVKSPLKRLFKDLLPNEIIHRKKVGFPVSLENILPPNLKGNTYIDKWFEYNIKLLMEVM